MLGAIQRTVRHGLTCQATPLGGEKPRCRDNIVQDASWLVLSLCSRRTINSSHTVPYTGALCAEDQRRV